MTMTINGRKALPGLLLLLLLAFYMFFRVGGLGTPHGRQPELQTFQLRDGWGYQILVDGKVFIYQPTIPAIDSEKAFPDQESARKVGMLVLKRIKSKKDPTVTHNEINHSLSY